MFVCFSLFFGPLWSVVELLSQDIALAFVGRFRCSLQRFFAKEKPFLAYGIVFKTIARWRYAWCPNGRKKVENMRK